MVRRRAVRSVLPLPDSAVLVRALFEVYEHGAVFDRDVLIGDAAYNVAEFGYYGLSLWLAQDPWPLGRILAEKTRRASRAALFTAGDLGGQSLTLVASGREPHYDATDGTVITGSSGSVRVTAGSADELADRFLAASCAVRDNEFYEQDLR